METILLADRRYLFWPAPNPGPATTVVFLAGTGGAAEWVESETHLAAFARTAGFAVAVPAGLPPRPRQPAGFLSNPFRWNDGSTTPADPHHSTTDDVAFLDAVFADLVANRNGNPHRLALAGFSNGAGMAFRYASHGHMPLAALIAVAGHCWVDPPPLARPVPTLYLIGDRDPLVPVEGGEVRIPWGNRVVVRQPIWWTLSKWAVANGLTPTPVESVGAHGVRTFEYGHGRVRAHVIPGLGHHWPGGAGQLNPRLGGPMASPVSANELLGEFINEWM